MAPPTRIRTATILSATIIMVAPWVSLAKRAKNFDKPVPVDLGKDRTIGLRAYLRPRLTRLAQVDGHETGHGLSEGLRAACHLGLAGRQAIAQGPGLVGSAGRVTRFDDQ